jgi:lipopolysaccharide transport system permease protein
VEIKKMSTERKHIVALAQSIYNNWFVLIQLTRSEVLTRYRGSMLGLVWVALNPVFMLIVYTFVFSTLLKARWAVQDAGNAVYALQLFAGIVVHAFFSECLIQSTSIVSRNINFVKKIVFPLDMLPVVTIISATINMIIGILVAILAVQIIGDGVTVKILLIPFVFIPFIIFMLGISLIVCTIGVYVKDIGHVTGLISTAMLFLSPVLYPLSFLPESIREMAWINPLSFIIEQFRLILLHGEGLNWTGLFIYLMVSIVVLSIGYYFFQKHRWGFSDAI